MSAHFCVLQTKSEAQLRFLVSARLLFPKQGLVILGFRFSDHYILPISGDECCKTLILKK